MSLQINEPEVNLLRRIETLTGEVLALKSLISRLTELLGRVDKVEKIIGIK